MQVCTFIHVHSVVRMWVGGFNSDVTASCLGRNVVSHWFWASAIRCSRTLAWSKQCKVVWRSIAHRWDSSHNCNRSVPEGEAISRLVVDWKPQGLKPLFVSRQTSCYGRTTSDAVARCDWFVTFDFNYYLINVSCFWTHRRRMRRC